MGRDKLEYKTISALVKFLKIRGWLVQRMSADAFFKGFPDLYCASKKWGERWIQAKLPESYTLTQPQVRRWSLWEELRIGVWILTAATQEEYDKLVAPPNWRDFCKEKVRVPAQKGIRATLDESRCGSEGPQKAEKEAQGDPWANLMSLDKPESQIQEELIEFLKARQWHVDTISADMFQNGLPDLFCAHEEHGTRWVEVKRRTGYTFTNYQSQRWPVWDEFRIGIWILTAATQEEYDKLFKPANWRDYWKEEFRGTTREELDAMIEKLAREHKQQMEREEEQRRQQQDREDCYGELGGKNRVRSVLGPPEGGVFGARNQERKGAEEPSLPGRRPRSRHSGTCGEGPKLPYQALVVRQSATLLFGFSP